MGSCVRSRQAIESQRGASAVEFVLVVPLLLVVVFAIITYGLVAAQQIALNHAVREGARAAVVVSTGSSSTVSDKVNTAFTWDSASDAVTVTTAVERNGAPASGVTTCGSGLGDDLFVEGTYSTWTPISSVPGVPDTLKAGTVFRCEF